MVLFNISWQMPHSPKAPPAGMGVGSFWPLRKRALIEFSDGNTLSNVLGVEGRDSLWGERRVVVEVCLVRLRVGQVQSLEVFSSYSEGMPWSLRIHPDDKTTVLEIFRCTGRYCCHQSDPLATRGGRGPASMGDLVR